LARISALNQDPAEHRWEKEPGYDPDRTRPDRRLRATEPLYRKLLETRREECLLLGVEIDIHHGPALRQLRSEPGSQRGERYEIAAPAIHAEESFSPQD
jgi:hypothetical protein